MEYFLTRHAKDKLTERTISLAVLEAALEMPTEIRENGKGKWLLLKLYRRLGKKRLLKVVVSKDGSKLKVITVIETSKVKKYLSWNMKKNKPKIKYSKESGVLSLRISRQKSVDSDIHGNVVLDYDKAGKLVGVDLYNFNFSDFKKVVTPSRSFSSITRSMGIEMLG